MSAHGEKTATDLTWDPFESSALVAKVTWTPGLLVTLTAELPDSCTSVVVKSAHPPPEMQIFREPDGALIELAATRNVSAGSLEARKTWTATVALYNSDYVPHGIRISVNGRVRMTMHPVREKLNAPL